MPMCGNFAVSAKKVFFKVLLNYLDTRLGLCTRGLYYKTYYGHNLQIFVISWSVFL
jgi:hypothetical protein